MNKNNSFRLSSSHIFTRNTAYNAKYRSPERKLSDCRMARLVASMVQTHSWFHPVLLHTTLHQSYTLTHCHLK